MLVLGWSGSVLESNRAIRGTRSGPDRPIGEPEVGFLPRLIPEDRSDEGDSTVGRCFLIDVDVRREGEAEMIGRFVDGLAVDLDELRVGSVDLATPTVRGARWGCPGATLGKDLLRGQRGCEDFDFNFFSQRKIIL